MAIKSEGVKSGTAAPNTESVRPRYLSPGTFYEIGLHDIIRALKIIEENGYRDEFNEAANESNASVRIPAQSVNFVKDFMAENNMHEHPVGKHIINAARVPGGDPYRPCNFGRH